MKIKPSDQSLNRIPCYTDWHRYESPTVIRRHGRGFLERIWKPGQRYQEPGLSRSELVILVESFGGVCLLIKDQTLLLFADYHWARRCQHQLSKRGVSTMRLGCYLQLQGAW